MTPGGHEKFLFDRDFEKDEEEAQIKKAAAKAAKAAEQAALEAEAEATEALEPEAPPPPSYSEADLAQAREEGRIQGRDEATQDMTGAIEQRTAQALEALNGQMTQLFQMYELDKEQHSRDAVAVAEVIVRKLFPAINMDKALAEIEHMIVEAMKRTSGSPQLIIRVAADMHGEVETRANELAALRGREGTVSVIGDPDVAPGDARVEWDGGGMVRDTGLIWREIDDIIERNLGERLEMPADGQAATPAPLEAEVVNPASVGDNMETAPESPEQAAGADAHPLAEPHPGPAEAIEAAPETAQEMAPDSAQEAAPEDGVAVADSDDTGPEAETDASDQDETEI